MAAGGQIPVDADRSIGRESAGVRLFICRFSLRWFIGFCDGASMIAVAVVSLGRRVSARATQ
jgi:hypothetical protein